MVNIHLSYYTHGSNAREEVWFRLISEGGYSWDSRLRNGNEDLRVIDFFLSSTKPSIVEVNFPENMDDIKKSRLELKVNQYLRSIAQKTLKI